MLGLGESAPENTSTPTPIRGLPSVGGVAASSNIGIAYLQEGAPPPPLLSVASATEALEVGWTAPAEAYRLRWRPLGTKPWSKLLEREGTCAAEAGCAYRQTFAGLGPQPYEVDLVDAKLSEGKTTHEKSRYITGTPAPAPGAPLNTALPAIGGSPQQGQSVTASAGTWTNSPTAYAYQWLRCEGYGEAGGEEELGQECEAIEGATTAAYTPQAADARHALRVSVKASNAAGWSLAVSRPEVVLGPGEETLALAPESVSAPTVSGLAVQGRTLTEHHGAWEGEVGTYSYKWLRCKARTSQGTGGSCGAIPGASGQSYTLAGEDVGMWIEVQETAANSGGWNVSTSEALEAIPPEVPVNAVLPAVTGTVQQGQTLSVREGTWTNNAKAPAWQWLRCGATGSGCTAIAGATKKTYKLEAEDVGHAVAVSETVENAVGHSLPASSAPTLAVPVPPPAPEATSLPTITGSAQQGQTLTEHPGGWTGQPTSYSYAWKRCSATGGECKAISAATKQTYQLTSADVGHTIVAKETAVNAGGSTPANSAGTATVAGAVPVDSSLPEIQGAAQQEQSLTATTGDLEQRTQRIRLPVAAVQLCRVRLHGDQRRERAQLHPHRRQRGDHDPGAREREQRHRRRRPGHLRSERPDPAGAARRERQPHDHGLRRRRPDADRARGKLDEQPDCPQARVAALRRRHLHRHRRSELADLHAHRGRHRLHDRRARNGQQRGRLERRHLRTDRRGRPRAPAGAHRDHPEPHRRRQRSVGDDQRQLALGRDAGHVRLAARVQLHGQLGHVDHRHGAPRRRRRRWTSPSRPRAARAPPSRPAASSTPKPRNSAAARAQGRRLLHRGLRHRGQQVHLSNGNPSSCRAASASAEKRPASKRSAIAASPARPWAGRAPTPARGNPLGSSRSRLRTVRRRSAPRRAPRAGKSAAPACPGRSSGNSAPPRRVALLLSSQQSGGALLAMQCGSSTVEVKGSVVVPVKSGSMLSSQTLKSSATKGIQEPSEYETAARPDGARLPGSKRPLDRFRTRRAEADPDAERRRSGRDQPGALGATPRPPRTARPA